MSETEVLQKNVKDPVWVIKIGSALLTQDGKALVHEALDIWVPQIAELLNKGIRVVLVSSGAVSEGMTRLGWNTRPNFLHELQAAAAVGQSGLIGAYQVRFESFDTQTAQVLLVHGDLSDRTRYLNAQQTIKQLLDLKVVPIVNENDTVATDEIRFGDNDTLAGLVANLVNADKLVILTDQQGVFTDDPRSNPNATLIKSCDVSDSKLEIAAKGSGGVLGRGGMATKIKSAKYAARSGTTTVIANGREQDVLLRLADNEALGTRIHHDGEALAPRKQWLWGLKSKGVLSLDAGAAKALRSSGVSLLAVGVSAVQGEFQRGDLVSCVDSDNKEIARGLIAYSSEDTARIIGQPSSRLTAILGYDYGDELIHRDNLLVI